MTAAHLVLRGIVHYWRTHVAVVVGVATAVAVLAGALLVGASVRGSLRELVQQRLGRVDRVVLASGFFRQALADDLRMDAQFATTFSAVSPLIAMPGVVTDPATGRRIARVQVYGVDDQFWRFHGLGSAPLGQGGPAGRDALLSRALAAEMRLSVGDIVIVRVERPSAIPVESLQGRKDNTGRSLRLTVRAVLGPRDLGDFSLQPSQGDVRAVFVPLARLQQDLDRAGRVNVLLVSDVPNRSAEAAATLAALIRRRADLDDVGLTLRVVGNGRELAIESPAGLLDRTRAAAIERAAADERRPAHSVLTYVANTIRSGDREIPYSLVTALDLTDGVGRPFQPSGAHAGPARPPYPIVLNEWAARDLNVKGGEPVTLEYFIWEEPGRLVTRSASFKVAAIVPIEDAAADRDLVPPYPGITEANTLSEWDPPFPVDLRRVRRIDEDYWKQYRTTPKAFIPIEVGQALWASRYGDRSSVRLAVGSNESMSDARDRLAARLRETLDPVAAGLTQRDVRADGIAASRGATDFGEYFTYFSFFLVASALLLAALFFRLGIEQRAREIGLLRAIGFSTPGVRRLFAAEGLFLSVVGGAIGTVGAVAYGGVMMAGLRTWWTGAVGTTGLTLHVSATALIAGAAGAVVAAMACIWWTLRGLSRLSERSLLAGQLAEGTNVSRRLEASRRLLFAALGCGVVGAGLIAATFTNTIDPTGGYFGAGALLLLGCLMLMAFRLRQSKRVPIQGRGWWSIARLGLRNATDRPGRSVLAVAVIASATFILISVDAFRRDQPVATDRRSGIGGYPLQVDLLVPIAHDPNSPEGRDALGSTSLTGVRFEPFRVMPGDDASCLNLYEPKHPRILGASRQFIEEGRFTFQRSLASADAEHANPWLLLNRTEKDDAVPVIADANSMTYVLHKSLGEDIVIDRSGRPTHLRLVGALSDSIFQSELMMSAENFQRLFPEQDGYQFLLAELPAGGADRTEHVAEAIEQGAADLGADAMSTRRRLAEFHTVENTYLSTFQALGGLGLLVGTVGLAAILLRNVLERRRELALLGAVGYTRPHIFSIVVAENLWLVGWGLAIGIVCALVAISPTLAERGWRPSASGGGWSLLFAVLVAALVSSIVATRAALKTALLQALRSE